MASVPHDENIYQTGLIRPWGCKRQLATSPHKYGVVSWLDGGGYAEHV